MKQSVKQPIVFLDGGHGGHDPGALGPTGLRESDMAQDVCIRAQKKLRERGVDARLTRMDDTYMTLASRPAMANQAGADAFVSYHLNSAESPSAEGWEIFTTKGQNNSDKLADSLAHVQLVTFPDTKQRRDMRDGDPDKEANYAVIRLANCPAVLVEGDFIHTAKGEKLIGSENWRDLQAEVLAHGIVRFLTLNGKLVKLGPGFMGGSDPDEPTLEKKVELLWERFGKEVV